MNAYGDTITLVQADLVTGYGGRQVRDWANATRTSHAAAVQPLTGRENTAGRQVTYTTRNLHCDAYVPLRAVDRVEHDGKTYEVEGEPEIHYMGGRPDHIEAMLNLVEEAAT